MRSPYRTKVEFSCSAQHEFLDLVRVWDSVVIGELVNVCCAGSYVPSTFKTTGNLEDCMLDELGVCDANAYLQSGMSFSLLFTHFNILTTFKCLIEKS